MTIIQRWWRRLTGTAIGRRPGSSIVRTKRAACRYTPQEWAQLTAATEKDLKRLAREWGRTKGAIRQAWKRAQQMKPEGTPCP